MSGPLPDAVAMTFAGLAYGPPAAIPGYVASGSETAGWTVTWLAAPPPPPAAFDNFAFLAVSATGQEAVLAIRGTYPDPLMRPYWDDAAEDNPLQPMKPWAGGGRIGGGTATGLAKLIALTNASGVTIDAAVAKLAAGTQLTVTGHSLGGTLTPVMALQLAGQFPALAVAGMSFAGMTPGDSGFAALFAKPGAPPVRRVFNTLDTVAYGWDQVLATVDFYQPQPQGGALVQFKLKTMARDLAAGGYDYTAVGTPVPLTGRLQGRAVRCDLVGYLFEMLHQHLPDTYLALLFAPPLPFKLGFGPTVHADGIPDPLHPPVAFAQA